MTTRTLYEVVAVTNYRGENRRWALRQLETGAGHFINLDGTTVVQVWETLRDLDAWLKQGRLPEQALVIWPPQISNDGWLR